MSSTHDPHSQADAINLLLTAADFHDRSGKDTKEANLLIKQAVEIMKHRSPNTWEMTAAAAGVRVSNDPVKKGDDAADESHEVSALPKTPKPRNFSEPAVKFDSPIVSDVINDTAGDEPQAQFLTTREDQFHVEALRIAAKIDHGEIVEQTEADHLHAVERRAHGYTQKGGVTAAAQSLAARQHDDESKEIVVRHDSPHPRKVSLSPADTSQTDRENNFLTEAEWMASKLEKHDPVTDEEAQHLHRIEVRAHSTTDKGSISAQAQSAAAKQSAAFEVFGEPVGSVPSFAAEVITGSVDEQGRQMADQYREEAEAMTFKLNEHIPITLDDASHLRSLETKVLGHTEKGGIAAKAQSAADKRRDSASPTSKTPMTEYAATS